MAGSAPPAVVDLFSLTGKTAIVTGGTGGLGLAMTTSLAEGGADIISIELPGDPNSPSLEKNIRSLGRKLATYECDVSNSKMLRDTFARIWQDGHQGDILLNCAGIQRRAQAEEFDDEAIDAVLSVNLKATFVAGQEFAKRLLEQKRPGKIINVASIIAFLGGNNIAPYAATKGAVLQTTKAFSNEWAGRGIQVNAICPGYYKTEMTRQYSEDPKYKDFNDYILGRVPAGRWGDPSDLRGAVIFLASKASDYMSGQSLVVDGGMIAK